MGAGRLQRVQRARETILPLPFPPFSLQEGRGGGCKRLFFSFRSTKSLVADAARFLTVLLVSRALSLRGE